jgi:hypothetical protein
VGRWGELERDGVIRGGLRKEVDEERGAKSRAVHAL